MQKNKSLSVREVGIMNTNKAYLGVYMALALAANVAYHALVSNLFT
ncbi:hypothetical protein GCM10023206_17850 [Acinetobacter puyangensis]|jgi:hypothetical protein|uniref:Uncharacterized protein n=1 Tax=Acinetobacter puyangensis TaxID=1096779 RepID=A0A240E5U2_9GAMM|nr:hypothetical protein SAMN05421731_102110 [Acinetobacter puyangensis]